jgi:ABC-type nitrate/sulfonate/bicarbonate transport system substrate-binding protein
LILKLSAILSGFLMSLFIWILLLSRPVEAAPLRVADSAISGAMSSLWVAQEGGYFKREGLDVELLISAAARC